MTAPPMFDAAVNLDLTPATWSGRGAVVATATIQKRLPGGATGKLVLPYATVDGVALVEGDIVLGPEDVVKRRERQRLQRFFGFTIVTGETWPDGVIPYDADPELGPLADWAAAYFAQRTPLRLVRRSGQKDYVYFAQAAANQSDVGCKRKGPQIIGLSASASHGDVIHEIGHALGLWHEHTRPDRDTYIQVLEANIVDGDQWMFKPQPITAGDFRSPYDISSIMHYPSWASARSGVSSLLTRNGQMIPARDGLSGGDLAALRALYPRLDWR